MTHTAIDIGPIGSVFDGRTDTLARTPGINPMSITLEFQNPKEITGSEVWFLGGTNRWRIETAESVADLDTASGSFRVALDWRQDPEAAWNQRSVSSPITCRAVRLKIVRLTGDGYVHLNEWRLLSQKRPFQVTDFREMENQRPMTWNSDFGRWYQIESSPDLHTWSSTGFVKGGETATSHRVERPSPDRHFFRINEALPEERPFITKRVLVMNLDPIIESQGYRRLHQVLGWNDPRTLNADYLEDLTNASGGYVRWELAAWVDLDLWPIKSDGFQYTDTTYLQS